MKTKEEVILEATAICQRSHDEGDGCIRLQCVNCEDGWNILECSNESLWKKYQAGCLVCRSEYRLELGHCEL